MLTHEQAAKAAGGVYRLAGATDYGCRLFRHAEGIKLQAFKQVNPVTYARLMADTRFGSIWRKQPGLAEGDLEAVAYREGR